MVKKAFTTAIISAALAFPLAGCEVENDEDITPAAPGVQTPDTDVDTTPDMDMDMDADDPAVDADADNDELLGNEEAVE